MYRTDLELELNAVRLSNKAIDLSEGLAQMIEPDGNPGAIVGAVFAERFCSQNPEWGWRKL